MSSRKRSRSREAATPDTRIQEHEEKVRPSERFAERCNASNGTRLATLLHECRVSSHPLRDWQDYISYYTTKYNNPAVEFQIQQRCVMSCIYMPQYKNDVEFVKVLVHYAKLCQDPLNVFQFAWECRVGRETAMFWMSWTWFAEKAKDYSSVVKERFACFKLRMRDLGIDLDSLRDTDRHRVKTSRSRSRSEQQTTPEIKAGTPLPPATTSVNALTDLSNTITTKRSRSRSPKQPSKKIREDNANSTIEQDLHTLEQQQNDSLQQLLTFEIMKEDKFDRQSLLRSRQNKLKRLKHSNGALFSCLSYYGT
ncbi:hypothetical protein CTEN210_09217 [Chaetoceros tenuissimus]|uniref:BUB1 N-terminal domain-containing protein n=1 Tax=Chaetoceros tenuissimus TaxID=426638 RepID=A0AAD3H757_9STRA|nr:hypothetical protein CTEN210_09217 [Chaetoceros tenuissimus]